MGQRPFSDNGPGLSCFLEGCTVTRWGPRDERGEKIELWQPEEKVGSGLGDFQVWHLGNQQGLAQLDD